MIVSDEGKKADKSDMLGIEQTEKSESAVSITQVS